MSEFRYRFDNPQAYREYYATQPENIRLDALLEIGWDIVAANASNNWKSRYCVALEGVLMSFETVET